MNLIIIPNNPEIIVHSISKEINILFNKVNFINNYISSINFCCINENNKIISLYNNNKNQFSFFVDIPADKAFLFFIKNFINEKNIDISISYQILLICEKLNFKELDYYDIFKFLHWQSSKKGLDYFNAIKIFSPILKEKVLNKKLSINEAYFFHNHFKNNYDTMLEKLPENISFSNLNNITRYITEYSKKENIELNTIIKQIDFSNEIELLNSALKLKYSKYTKLLNIFKLFIEKIKLPKNSKIIFDDTFENDEYKLEIKFNNINNLKDKLTMINQSIINIQSNTDFKDLFIHKNLFDESKK